MWWTVVAAIMLVCLKMSVAFTVAPARVLTMRLARGGSFLYMAESNDEKISEELIKGLSAAAETTKKGLTRFGSSLAEGGNFKQAVADALAGDFDREATQKKIQESVESGKVVMFTWQASPSCKKAISLLEGIGCDLTVVRLDDPWDTGNQVRAELGRMVGRTSVPAIFIDGTYVGGCDDGPTDEAPGIISLAFQGLLRSKLIKAGALEKDFMIDL